MKEIPERPSRKLEVGLAWELAEEGGCRRGLKPGVQRSTLAPRFTPAATLLNSDRGALSALRGEQGQECCKGAGETEARGLME